MKYLMYILNCLLIIIIPVTFIMTPVHKKKATVLKSDNKIKKLKSAAIKLDKKEEPKKENKKEEEKKEETKETKEVSVQKEKVQVNNTSRNTETKQVVRQTQPRIVSKPTPKPTPTPTTDVLETVKGKMSGYGPDCKGCSGNLASGINARNGNIYYNDKKYGKIRIVAGDRKYKFGTIVRIKNSKAGNNIIAAVLDRGGSIGIGKTFLFDLLYASEKDAKKYEVSYNVTFEILRYGY